VEGFANAVRGGRTPRSGTSRDKAVIGLSEIGIDQTEANGRDGKLKVLRKAHALYRHGASLPATLAFNAVRIPFIRTSLDEHRARAVLDHASRLPALPALDTAIIGQLERNGAAITSLEALGVPGTGKMFEAAKILSGTLAERCNAHVRANSAFLEATAADLMHHPEIYRWGVNDRVLGIVETYLGLPVGYDGLTYYYNPANGQELRTRLWHRDLEDLRMVKVAVYISDVDEGGGPLQILQSELRGHLGRRHVRSPSFSQSEIEKYLGEDHAAAAITTCTGSAGTVVFADTARHYHRGKPPSTQDRSAIFYSYFARRPRYPFLCERCALSRADIKRLAAGLPQHQRDCILWRSSLPRPWRWIPPSVL
jgi:hypothetical protein